MLALTVDHFQNVLDVNTGSDEFSARSLHHLEQLFTALIDHRYVGEIHRASHHVMPAKSDPQHCASSRRIGECTCRAKRGEIVIPGNA